MAMEVEREEQKTHILFHQGAHSLHHIPPGGLSAVARAASYTAPPQEEFISYLPMRMQPPLASTPTGHPPAFPQERGDLLRRLHQRNSL